MTHLSPEMIEAAHDGDVGRIAALHQQGDSLLGTCESGGDLLYHFLWQCCDAAKLQQLLELGCKPANAPAASGTPLVAAIWGKEPQVVKELLDAGADPNVIAFVGDDEMSALDTVIDDYCECDSKEELARMIEIEHMIRSAGGRVHRMFPQSGEFPNWSYP